MRAMKICIIGAGAIGGFIGARLAIAGRAEVSALARNATLHSLREHGWRLRQAGEQLTAPVHAASDSAAELGPQDLVVIAVKGPALGVVARGIAPLLGPGTRARASPVSAASRWTASTRGAPSPRPSRASGSSAVWCTSPPPAPRPAWCSTASATG
jgi:pyrroline-5-carboxylate reductase